MKKYRRAIFAGFCLALSVGAAEAQSFAAPEFEALLAQGRTGDAVDLAGAALKARPGDDTARFALGMGQFLLAVEHLGQGLYRYGLRAEPEGQLVPGLFDLPFLRLPVPQNPEPELVSHAALNGLLAGFVADLAVAEASLAAVPDRPVKLALRLNRVRLDLDGDGLGGGNESLSMLFGAVTGARGPVLSDDDDFPVSFDQSDAPWLRGYCHLLMAMAEVPLAHDWSKAFEQTFHSLFAGAQVPSSGIAEEERRLRALLEVEAPGAKFPQTPQGPRAKEMRDARNALAYGGLADLVAFVHLFNWPVTDASRMQSARLHLLSMVELSRESWRRILAETDDDREWVPGPHQSSILPRMSVTEARLRGWNLFLGEFEAVLKGEKLIPHWRFDSSRGVNVMKMFDEPRALDPVMLAQGAAALPYLEEGEVVRGSTVETVFELMEGGFMRYFIWFN